MRTFVDAHHHFVDPQRFRYGELFFAYHPEAERYTGPEELERELAICPAEATVVVQALDAESETDWMLEIARARPWIAGVVGWLPLADPEATARAVERRLDGADSKLCGARHIITNEPDPYWAASEPVLESLVTLARHDLAFDLMAYSNKHLACLDAIAERAPELSVVIDHMGRPPIERSGERAWEPWATSMARAATNPRCAVKLTAHGLVPDEGKAELPDRARRYIDHVLEHFGTTRVMWGSNWPVSLPGRPYTQLLALSEQMLAGLSPADGDEMRRGAARRTYPRINAWVERVPGGSESER